MIWHDPLKDKPEKNKRIVIWMTSGGIVSGQYEPDLKERPYYAIDFDDPVDGDEIDEYQVMAWAERPIRSEIGKEEQDE